jgi:hypothetical protein
MKRGSRCRIRPNLFNAGYDDAPAANRGDAWGYGGVGEFLFTLSSIAPMPESDVNES